MFDTTVPASSPGCQEPAAPGQRTGSVACSRRLGRIATLLGLASLAGGLAGCGPGRATVDETVLAFLQAVQAQDTDRLYCLMAGAAEAEELGDESERRERFGAWVEARFEAYLEGRDRGRVELEEHGVELVKLFALGKGTFFAHGIPRRVGPGAVAVETDLRFGYAHVDLSRFTPGTTFYVCGMPVGRVHPVRVPVSGEVTLELLDQLKIEWTLLRRPAGNGCADRWTVASVAPVEGSEVWAEFTWVF